MEVHTYSPSIILLASTLISFAVAIFHYEILGGLTTAISQIKHVHRYHVLIAMLALTLTHLLSVLIYAGIYYIMINILHVGGILNTIGTHFDSSKFQDLIYYSITVYTSLGFGEIVPTGGMRVISGLETLNGLVLVAWTASYSYLVMSKYWSFKNTNRKYHFK